MQIFNRSSQLYQKSNFIRLDKTRRHAVHVYASACAHFAFYVTLYLWLLAASNEKLKDSVRLLCNNKQISVVI